MTDLYADLGVDRAADAAAVKRAYRKKSKGAHPDAGGSAEAFAKVRGAYLVLVDPQRRSKYDETGEVDDVGPDNDEAMAREKLCATFAAIMDKLQDKTFETDIMGSVIDTLHHYIAEANTAIAKCETMVKVFKKVRSKIKPKRRKKLGVLEQMMDQRIAALQRQADAARHAIKVHKRAVELAEHYDFEWEPPVQPEVQVVRMGGGAFFSFRTGA